MSDLVPLDALNAWWRVHLPQLGTVKSARKTSQGQSNPTFVLESSGGTFILRRKPPGKLLKSAHAVEREFRVMTALDGHAPVPKMYALCEDTDILGTAFFIMDYVEGRIFPDPALPDLSPDERAAIYDAMNAGLAGLHRLDADALGLSDYGKPGNYFARQLDRWTRQYRASETEQVAQMEDLITWLGEHLPADDGQVALVHGDWRIDNLVFAPKGCELVAILDWELSTLGHPLADLGAQLMQWAMPPGDVGRGLDGVDRKALGIPQDAEYVEAYAERAGLGDVPDMTYPVAFAFFRMGAILQGVKKRALDGNAANPEKAIELGAYVPLFAQKALARITSGL